MNRKQRRQQKRRGTGQGPPQARFAEAVALLQAGKTGKAKRLAAELLAEFPGVADLYQLRGMIALGEHALGDAETHLSKGLSVDPDNAALADLLGTTLLRAGKVEEAVAASRRAVSAAPGDAGMLNNLGNALMLSGDLQGAVDAYESSLHLRPGDARTQGNLGGVFKKMHRWRDAEAAYRRCLAADPDDLETQIDLGEAILMDRRWAEAIDVLDRAIDGGADNPDAFVFKGKALMALGRLPEAEQAIEAGLRFDADHPFSLQTRSALHFFAERWAAGWRDFEARWRMSPSPPRPFRQPLWDGQPCAEEMILAWGEQGVGDELMYASMVPDMERACAHLVLESDPRLVPLFRRSFPAVECVARADPPDARTAAPDIAFQVPLGNLGKRFRGAEDDFPGGAPYLRADPERAAALRARYAAGQVKTVGLAWFSSRAGFGVDKSMPLMTLAPLFDVPGLRFVDLQYGDTASERAEFRDATGGELVHDETIDQMADIDTFAAQVAALDLVISISNTTVHLAGSLGVPTWLMLNAYPDRRWMLQRDDSPWYGSVRIFRQVEPGDWGPVVSRVADELAGLVSA